MVTTSGQRQVPPGVLLQLACRLARRQSSDHIREIIHARNERIFQIIQTRFSRDLACNKRFPGRWACLKSDLRGWCQMTILILNKNVGRRVEVKNDDIVTNSF
jgi:hypothetical protein